jgi:A/G-specific adenine glycosylase
MLQQTQVKTVIPYWKRWMHKLPTIQSLAKAKPETIHKLWEGLGYYTRVRNMQKAAQQIVLEHGGRFPREYEAILNLPGIGRYTAGAIASIAFNEPRPILDGNVIRVLTRLFGIRGDPREKSINEQLWQLADNLVHAAPQACSQLNQSLMELGATVCTPRQPKCSACPLKRHCVAHKMGREEQFPEVRPRVKSTHRRFIAFVIEDRGRLLVRQRPKGIVNAHLWEFPNVELNGTKHGPHALAKTELGFAPAALEKRGEFKHSITRYRITVEIFHGQVNRPLGARKQSGQWVQRDALDALAFTAAHRRILHLRKAR